MEQLETRSAVASHPELDDIVGCLAARTASWVREDVGSRAAMLRRSIDGVLEVAAEWVRLGCAAKGIDPASPLAGEEWFGGPMTTVRGLRLLAEALEAGGQPAPVRWRRREGGQMVADVFPATLRERLMYSRMTVEVWVEPGQPPTQGRLYREKAAGVAGTGGVCLVLGAGNVASIGPLDVIYKLFVEDFVVILKMNPVNAYLAPLFRRAFKSLVDAGYLAIVDGGADIGEYLAHHPQIDAIHLTGSDRTYDAVVWGSSADEQARRQAERRPRVGVPVTAELGCVTPVLVVPGDWSESDLAYQARNVASMVVHNASFNCNAAKVVVLARGWALRDRFLTKFREALAAVPSRVAYYPGARERYRQFLDRYPQATALSPASEGVVPWTLIPGVAPSRDEYALSTEAFCGVVAEVSLDAADAPSFLAAAVPFANESVRGELSCMVLVDEATARRHRAALDAALAGLRYGGVAVNAWAGVNFAIGAASWGAYPGNRPDAIGSGIGVVHNSLLIDHPQKSIVRAPFRMFPLPVWFAGHRSLDRVGQLALKYEAAPSWPKLVATAVTALRG